MRTLKFRAWDKEQREFISWEKLIWQSQGLLNALHNAGTPEHYGNWLAQQYTGLKDKNGVEIYEGDILHYAITDEDSLLYTKEYNTSVAWGNKGQWQTSPISGFGGSFSMSEVIGNIYETPELLKDE